MNEKKTFFYCLTGKMGKNTPAMYKTPLEITGHYPFKPIQN